MFLLMDLLEKIISQDYIFRYISDSFIFRGIHFRLLDKNINLKWTTRESNWVLRSLINKFLFAGSKI